MISESVAAAHRIDDKWGEILLASGETRSVFSPIRDVEAEVEPAPYFDPVDRALTVLQLLCMEDRQLWRVEQREIAPGTVVPGLRLAPSVVLDQHHLAWKARHAYETERRRLQAETERYPILGRHLL